MNDFIYSGDVSSGFMIVFFKKTVFKNENECVKKIKDAFNITATANEISSGFLRFQFLGKDMCDEWRTAGYVLYDKKGPRSFEVFVYMYEKRNEL